MSLQAERAAISHAICFGNHTDYPLEAKHFVKNHILGEIWMAVKDVNKPNVLELAKKFDERLLSELVSESNNGYFTMRDVYDNLIEEYTTTVFLRELDLVRVMVREGGATPEQAMEQLREVEVVDTSAKEPRKLSAVMLDVYNEVEAISNGDRECALFIPSGFSSVDKIFFGFERSAYTVIAARPSMGKTAFAMGVALNMSIAGYKILIITLEMSNESIVYRLLSSEAHLDLQLLRKGDIKSPDAWGKMAAATNRMADAEMYLDDTPNITMSQIRVKARRMKQSHGLDAIFIDYMGLMDGEDQNSKRHEQVSVISKGMKSLSKEMDCAVIALSQLGRDVEKRNDKRPMMSDLRDSGSVEQDADVICMLYRDEYYHKKPENEGLAEVIWQKNRNGPVGMVKMHFHDLTATFKDLQGEPEWD